MKCIAIALPSGEVAVRNENNLVHNFPTQIVKRYEANHFLTSELEAGFQMHPKSLQFGNQCLNLFDLCISRYEKEPKWYTRRYSNNKFKYSK